MDYDALATKFGATDSAPTADYDALATKFGAVESSPVPKQNTFADSLKQELANADWGTRQIAGFGVATSDLWERAKQLLGGKEDRQQIEANKIIADAAPVGAFAGEMMSPQSLATMKLMPVLKGASTLAGKAGQYLGNVGIGATAGAGLATLKPDANAETIGEGAVGGAVASGVIAPLVSMAAKGSAWAYDALRGKLGDLKAAQIYRDIVGKDFAAVQSANRAAPDSLTAAQAASGIQNDPLQALGELAKRNDKTTYFRPKLDAQEAAQEAIKQRIAGGSTQTEAMATRIGDKKALNAEFVPRMNTELAAANEGQKLAQYQGQANALGDAAANKVQDVRRMTDLGAMADDMSMAGRNTNNGTMNLRGLSLGARAENEAIKAAGDSLILGEGRRFSQGIADSLEAHGIKPLDANPILNGLQRRLADPASAGNKKYETVLGRVASDIQQWAERNGGVIDSRALYAIRKNSVNDAVETLTAGLDPKASAKYAAQILSEVRPMVDKAIVDAGGTAWPTTLKIFEKGMIPIERKEMGAKLLDMSKSKFYDTVTGNNPKAVTKNFGPGTYDINAEMGGKMRDLSKVAGEYGRDTEMLRQAKAGEGGLARILDQDITRFRFPAWLNRETTVVNKALDIMEGKVERKVMDRLVESQRSGKDANKLLELLPTSQRKNFLNAMIEAGGYSPALVAGSAAVQ